MSTKEVSNLAIQPLTTMSGSIDGIQFSTSSNKRKLLTTSTEPKVGKAIVSEYVALSGGGYNLDLTSGPDGGNLTGLYVRTIMIEAHEDNEAPIIFTKGGSDGITFGGDNDDQVPVQAGGKVFIDLGADGPVIDATHKVIAAASTDTTAQFRVEVTAGSNS